MSLASRWEQARLEFFKARIRHLVDDGKWQHALMAVIDFAQWAEERIDDAEIWLGLTVTATRIVGHLEDPAEYRAFLVHFASPFLGDSRRPRAELIEAFATIADHAEPSVMISIGRWLTDARPGWPLGPYLVAHFREIPDNDETSRPDPAATATHFQLAAERAERTGLDDWEIHCRLRQGSLLLSAGVDRRRGREILGEIDWTRLYPTEQLWMAVALASSGRWTDRLRAMDIVLDLHRSISASRPRYSDLRLRDLRRTAATIFKLAGLQLPEAESRRLEELSETIFSGGEQETWKNFLHARRKLSKVSALPFDQSEEVLPLLDKLGAVYPERWKPAAHRFRILSSGWNGDYQATDSVPSPRRHGSRLPIVDAIAELLTFLDEADANTDNVDERLNSQLDGLAEALEKLSPAGDVAAARPVALVWTKLMDNQDVVDLQSLESTVARLARAYAAVSPPPGYGWWTLSAHLFDADLVVAAQTIAERAIAADEPGVDEKIRHFVATKAFEKAVESTNAVDARRWLDVL